MTYGESFQDKTIIENYMVSSRNNNILLIINLLFFHINSIYLFIFIEKKINNIF